MLIVYLGIITSCTVDLRIIDEHRSKGAGETAHDDGGTDIRIVRCQHVGYFSHKFVEVNHGEQDIHVKMDIRRRGHLGDKGIYYLMLDLEKRYEYSQDKPIPRTFAFHVDLSRTRRSGPLSRLWRLLIGPEDYGYFESVDEEENPDMVMPAELLGHDREPRNSWWMG